MQNEAPAGKCMNGHMDDIPVLKVRELAFHYENKAGLVCPCLDVQKGECLAFTGPNGSGKTTLLKLLNGLLGPYSGRIEFMGQPLGSSKLLRRHSVYLHQHPVLFAGSVRDNIAYALKLKHFNRDEAQARLMAAAGRFGISGLLDREAGRLSGGETQRVAMARAVAAGADVLLLDEPTSSMDKDSEHAVRELLFDLKKDGATILFSAHDEDLVTRLADRVLQFGSGTAVIPGAASAPEDLVGLERNSP
jgi:energy-coupling factor transporter ATP-binding protein EcfA2